MSKYRIGITEAGDAGLDLSWECKLDKVDGAILITKCITSDFVDAAFAHKEKLIVHATITGYGKTVVEPNVPAAMMAFNSVMALIHAGFPEEKIVIRVDPIIPTPKGLEKALQIIEWFMDVAISRYRISVIDMYPHVRERFVKAGLPLPYGDRMFAGTEELADVDAMLLEAKTFWQRLGHSSNELRIESCAEPWLKEPIICGCISAYDLELLGLDPNKCDSAGTQRRHCMCYSGKFELLTNRHPCSHNCMYCYWRR